MLFDEFKVNNPNLINIDDNLNEYSRNIDQSKVGSRELGIFYKSEIEHSGVYSVMLIQVGSIIPTSNKKRVMLRFEKDGELHNLIKQCNPRMEKQIIFFKKGDKEYSMNTNILSIVSSEIPALESLNEHRKKIRLKERFSLYRNPNRSVLEASWRTWVMEDLFINWSNFREDGEAINIGDLKVIIKKSSEFSALLKSQSYISKV